MAKVAYWEDPKPFKDRPSFIVESRLTEGRSHHNGILIPKFGKFLLMESGILGFGIRNTAQGIRNQTMRIQNPTSTDKYWNPVSEIQDCPGSPNMGRKGYSLTFMLKAWFQCNKIR